MARRWLTSPVKVGGANALTMLALSLFISKLGEEESLFCAKHSEGGKLSQMKLVLILLYKKSRDHSIDFLSFFAYSSSLFKVCLQTNLSC